jgi:hypothetical protein
MRKLIRSAVRVRSSALPESAYVSEKVGTELFPCDVPGCRLHQSYTTGDGG